MKDYAKMSREQQTAYNEGLLDAIDELTKIGARTNTHSPFTAACYAMAATDIVKFRNNQINAKPQSEAA